MYTHKHVHFHQFRTGRNYWDPSTFLLMLEVVSMAMETRPSNSTMQENVQTGRNNGSRCSDESKIEIFFNVAEGILFAEGLEKYGGGSLQA